MPPGTYRIKAWHERPGEQEQKLIVTRGKTNEAIFTFKPDVSASEPMRIIPALLAGDLLIWGNLARAKFVVQRRTPRRLQLEADDRDRQLSECRATENSEKCNAFLAKRFVD